MMRRRKSKSVWEADGKPDLDLLEADRRPASRTAPACARSPSGRSGPGCRRAGRRWPSGAPAVNCRSGQVRSVSTRGTCDRYLSKGMGDGSQGRARRPRSLSSPLPFCPVAMSLSLSLVRASLDTGRYRPNKKPPGREWRRRLRANAMWRSPSGKQQVGRDVVPHGGKILPSLPGNVKGGGPRASRAVTGRITGRHGMGEPNLTTLPSGSVCAASRTPNPGSNRSLVSPDTRGHPLPVQCVGVVDGEVHRAGGLGRRRLVQLMEVEVEAVP